MSSKYRSRTFCGVVGNAMKLPIIVTLMRSIPLASGKIDAKMSDELQQRAYNFRPVE